MGSKATTFEPTQIVNDAMALVHAIRLDAQGLGMGTVAQDLLPTPNAALRNNRT